MARLFSDQSRVFVVVIDLITTVVTVPVMPTIIGLGIHTRS